MKKSDRDETKLAFFKGMKEIHRGTEEVDFIALRVAEELDGLSVKAYVKEVFKADDRMKPDQMQWLLNFVDLDLSKSSEGDWMNLKFEFVAFQSLKNLRVELASLRGITHPTRKDVQLFHSTAKKGLEKLIVEKRVVFNVESLCIIVEAPVEFHDPLPSTGPVGYVRDLEPWNVRAVVSVNRWSVSQYNLSALIGQFAHIIRRCPECNKFFLADRKNQSYCSKKHQGYASVRKYRKSKGLITGRPVGRPRKTDTPKKEGES